MRKRIVVLIILLSSLALHTFAQDSTEVDFQTWSDITTIHFFTDKWIYSGDYGVRGVLSGQDWQTLYARPTFRYNITPSLHARAGMALFYTYDQLIKNQLELRFHQEVNLKWPEVPGFIFKHMVRFEERFFFYKELDKEFSARARYRFAIESPDYKLFNIKGPFYGLANIEFFLPLGNQSTERYINNTRIVAGIGQRASQKFRYELHYIFQNSRKFIDDSLKTSEHILRLRLFLNLNTLE